MIETAFASSTGRVRKNNQDFVQVFSNKADTLMAIVCDGLGGHAGGDVASNMATTHLGHNFSLTDFTKLTQAQHWLKVQLELENETIMQTGQKFTDLKGMGTTIVLAIYAQQQVLFAHLGDSRAYLYTQNSFTQVTADHSLVSELVRIGEITPEQAKTHPQKNFITQALGVSKTVDPEYNLVSLTDGDICLLCTDGLSNSLTDEQISAILKLDALTAQQKCQRLIDEANRLGGEDNITVCLLFYRVDKETNK